MSCAQILHKQSSDRARSASAVSTCVYLLIITYSCVFLPISGTERCPQKGVVKQVASKLVRALSEKGLALLVNHGIPECKVHDKRKRAEEREREGGAGAKRGKEEGKRLVLAKREGYIRGICMRRLPLIDRTVADFHHSRMRSITRDHALSQLVAVMDNFCIAPTTEKTRCVARATLCAALALLKLNLGGNSLRESAVKNNLVILLSPCCDLFRVL